MDKQKMSRIMKKIFFCSYALFSFASCKKKGEETKKAGFRVKDMSVMWYYFNDFRLGISGYDYSCTWNGSLYDCSYDKLHT